MARRAMESLEAVGLGPRSDRPVESNDGDEAEASMRHHIRQSWLTAEARLATGEAALQSRAS